MDEEELETCQRLKDDFIYYAEKCLKIRTKAGLVEQFRLNRAQIYIHEKLEKQKKELDKIRALILKGRQQGCSTYVGGRFYHKTTHNRGVQTFILTHELKATDNLFKMAKRFYDNTPELVKPEIKTNNAKELNFGVLDSGYSLGTAENKATGRSSTIQFLHGSEVGFWTNAAEHATGIFQAVPDTENTEIILESTANGVGNYFHQMWQKAESGESDYIAIFIPWFWQEEYKRQVPEEFEITPDEEELRETYKLNNAQILWRRFKIIDLSINGQDGEKAFKQEYPCIVGSQRVGTNIGILPISDIINGLKTNTGEIMKQWCSGEKDTLCLETSLGYTLQCTLDHKIPTIENNFIEANKLIGETINLAIPKFSNYIPEMEWYHLPCLKSNLIMNEEFALFLGFFMGDGSYGGETLSIAFDKRDPISIQTGKQLILTIFNRSFIERTTSANGIELRVGIKSIKKLFFELGIIEKKSYGTKRFVCVPEIIWKCPINIIKEFIRGLFDSDGFAAKESAKISFFTKHIKFAKDVQLLLLGFGITCKRVQEIKKSGNGKDYIGYSLVLRASEARLFGKIIGFVSERKNARIREWLKPEKIGRTAAPIIYSDKVISISNAGNQLVYDLEMIEAPHIFDANGILVHNCNPTEAFQLTGENSFIPSDLVMKARKGKAERFGPLVIGVDPARFGDDRTSIIMRQGRHAFGIQSHAKKDTMEIVGIIHQLISQYNPAKVFIDIGGLGAGVFDRLKELGHGAIIVSVNAGSSPLDKIKYYNKRSELWGLYREWLLDEPCQIPDEDSLHADTCNIRYSYNSNSQLVMEQKAEMKKRGIRSPDEADAICLTFALPLSALLPSKGPAPILKSLAGDLNRKNSSIRSSYNR